MAFDLYLTIPGIPGESQTKYRLPGSNVVPIEITSYSWGLDVPVSIGSGTGGGAGKVSLSDFSIAKMFDSASPLLMQTLAMGKALAKITLSLVKSSGTGASNPGAFLLYEFDTVFVTSVSDSGSTGGGVGVGESISFVMEKVMVTYYPQNPDGTFGNPVKFTYDQSTGKSF